MQIEKRYKSGGLGVRADEKGGKITGLASVFYREGDATTEYELWPGVRERILPGAFSAVLAKNPDVRALVNHDSNLILGRTKAGTLRLSVTERGLEYEVDGSESSAYTDAMIALARGDIDGSSFAFRVEKSGEEWRKENGVDIREIREFAELYDVGPVTYPAYSGTDAGMRAGVEGGMYEARQSHKDWVDRDRHAKRLTLMRMRLRELTDS